MTNRQAIHWVVIAIVGGPLILVASCIACGYALSDATEFCPWSHKISDLAVCRVLDQDGNRVLIQHADLDINIYYLEIIEGGRSTEYRLPSFITRLAPEGYSARLIAGEDHKILIDGKIVELEPL